MRGMEATQIDLLRQAIKHAGSQLKLAQKVRALGRDLSQQRISQLLNGDGEITAEVAVGIHLATDGAVPASAFRPDLWVNPESVPRAPALSETASTE